MADYELITGLTLLGVNFIFLVLSTMLNNKPLKMFFLIILVCTIPLTLSYAQQLASANEAPANLVTLLQAGYGVSIFTMMGTIAFLVIHLIAYMVDRMGQAVGQRKALREGLEDGV